MFYFLNFGRILYFMTCATESRIGFVFCHMEGGLVSVVFTKWRPPKMNLSKDEGIRYGTFLVV
jgi:hypothetical protein